MAIVLKQAQLVDLLLKSLFVLFVFIVSMLNARKKPTPYFLCKVELPNVFFFFCDTGIHFLFHFAESLLSTSFNSGIFEDLEIL